MSSRDITSSQILLTLYVWQQYRLSIIATLKVMITRPLFRMLKPPTLIVLLKIFLKLVIYDYCYYNLKALQT